MENQDELNQKILAATIKIKSEYPELIKYLREIPEHFVTNPVKGEVKNKELKDYLDSLNELLETYSEKH